MWRRAPGRTCERHELRPATDRAATPTPRWTRRRRRLVHSLRPTGVAGGHRAHRLAGGRAQCEARGVGDVHGCGPVGAAAQPAAPDRGVRRPRTRRRGRRTPLLRRTRPLARPGAGRVTGCRRRCRAGSWSAWLVPHGSSVASGRPAPNPSRGPPGPPGVDASILAAAPPTRPRALTAIARGGDYRRGALCSEAIPGDDRLRRGRPWEWLRAEVAGRPRKTTGKP